MDFFGKEPVAGTSCIAAQLKLIHNLKSQTKTYCTFAMKMQIWKTFLKICIIQHYQANFIMKELLGDESAAHDEYEKDILHHLNIAVGSREEVIVDLCKNNGWKPKFEDLWQVKLY